jgi:hypothetical protein
MRRKSGLLLFFIFLYTCSTHAQKINRKDLVQRHKVVVTKANPLSSLTVGNGRFAFTTDVTGLQSFPKEYARGVSLGTESEWGWHSFIDTVGYRREEALKNYHVNNRNISYTVQWDSPQRNRAAANWFRQNPHRLQLGNLGFVFIKRNGQAATLGEIKDIHQELDPWTGEIRSHFTINTVQVDVSTYAHATKDAISLKVKSSLITEGKLKIYLRFPYPTGQWTDEGANYQSDELHHSVLIPAKRQGAVISHQLDTTKYFVHLWWSARAEIAQEQPHYFLVTPASSSDSFELTAQFTSKENLGSTNSYDETKSSSEFAWSKYWNSGGAIDFSGSTDERAFELERRIILSQYLMRAQEAGSFPPQETGLTYNSWFGKPHLEMHWWHAAHYALWGRIELLERSLDWYKNVLPIARSIAGRQGFEGARWQKMTDNSGEETPSTIGALLIWQQPHFIYFAELCYRDKNSNAVLNKYKELVFATADFMASFPYYDTKTQRYILGKGLIPAQERFKAEQTFNPAYELVYWKWALTTAQQWRIRLKMPRNKKWDEIIQKLSPLAVQNNIYLPVESADDAYTNPEYRTDHPSVLAALGVMPSTGQVDKKRMKNTFDWIWKNWNWKETWGWDFPMVAMTATRLNMPEKAIDALLMNIQTNTYLPSGHNYQDDRLRIYMPGNGGLLTAIAMMVGGYDNNSTSMPGIPKNGKWKVRWEGLRKMP